MPKRTRQPKKSQARKYGFLKRMNTVGGRNTIRNRRRKGRVRLALSRAK